MSTTFADVKNFLAPHASGGLCLPANESKLIDLVNEAQRRLYAVRPWIGVVAKYAVNVIAGTVTLPTALESALKVTSYSGTGATNAGALITDDVHAFVHDSDSIVDLQYTPSSPRIYAINATPLPTAVTVTGRKAFYEVTGNSSVMIIDDADALKLMLRALYYEDRGQLDMAKGYEDKAIAFLNTKADTAIETARLSNYQTRLSTAIYGSLDWVRCKLGLDLMNGSKINEAELVDKINKAEERLMAKGQYIGCTKEFSLSVPEEGLIYLPNEIEGILAATINDTFAPVYSQMQDYHENGPGFQQATKNNGIRGLIARGEKLIDNEYHRVYFISGNCPADTCVRILAKVRHQYKYNSNTQMQITCYPAIKAMVASLMSEVEDLNKARFFEQQAVAYLDEQLKSHIGGARHSLQVQGSQFALGSIRNLY